MVKASLQRGKNEFKKKGICHRKSFWITICWHREKNLRRTKKKQNRPNAKKKRGGRVGKKCRGDLSGWVEPKNKVPAKRIH